MKEENAIFHLSKFPIDNDDDDNNTYEDDDGDLDTHKSPALTTKPFPTPSGIIKASFMIMVMMLTLMIMMMIPLVSTPIEYFKTTPGSNISASSSISILITDRRQSRGSGRRMVYPSSNSNTDSNSDLMMTVP